MKRVKLIRALLATALLLVPAAALAQTGDLEGDLTDANGKAIRDATVTVGDLSVTIDFQSQGHYAISGIPAGNVTVEVVAPWFVDHQETADITDGQTTTLDLTLDARALQVLPDDLTLVKAYNETFDWTTDELSLHLIWPPTEARINASLYRKNPALYRDTSGEDTITPDPLPSIAGGTASGFDFPIPSGQPNEGQQAFDTSAIFDQLADTPLSAIEKTDRLMWEPSVKIFLIKWDLDKATNLYNVGVAVEQQRWGGDPQYSPQSLERLYLHGSDEIWVEVVFQSWVELGAGITDSDCDGRREVFAKVAPAHFDTEVRAQLTGDFSTKHYDTLGLKENLYLILDDLYTRTSPEEVSVIGEPFEVPGHGTLQYPFMVLEHSDGSQNVLLVGEHTAVGDETCGGGDADTDADTDTDTDTDADSDSGSDSGCAAASGQDFLPAAAMLALGLLLVRAVNRRRGA